jgi:hypothetical protein
MLVFSLLLRHFCKRARHANGVVVVEVDRPANRLVVEASHGGTAVVERAHEGSLRSLAGMLWYHLGQSEVNEDGLIETGTEAKVLGLDIDMHEMKQVQSHQLLLEHAHSVFIHPLQGQTLLHRKFNAILVGYQIEPHQLGYLRTNSQRCSDLQETVLLNYHYQRIQKVFGLECRALYH